MVRLAYQSNGRADGSDEKACGRFGPGDRVGPSDYRKQCKRLCGQQDTQRHRGAGGAIQEVPIVSEDQDDAAADEQRAETGQQDLAPSGSGGRAVSRTVMSTQGVRRLLCEDASGDQFRQLGVQPGDSLSHARLIGRSLCLQAPFGRPTSQGRFKR